MIRLISAVMLLGLSAAQSGAQTPARELFGGEPLPAALASEPIGFYSRGCMAGAVAMAPDGPTWQAMRLSRNRHWGLPILVDFLTTLSRDAAVQDGWPGLLLGDMSQPRGGPMLTGHASHQIGLDADIWLTPMPNRRLTEREREDISATIITEPGPHEVYANAWTAAHGRLIRRAALDPRVERIFVAPGIKRVLCQMPEADASWLHKVRPYYGHNYHFHVRLSCPQGTRCRSQDPPPAGDGCGADLDWWFTDEPYAAPSDDPPPPEKPLMLSDLPPACANVLEAEPIAGTMTMRQAFAMNIGAGGEAPPPAIPYVEVVEPARLPRPRPNI